MESKTPKNDPLPEPRPSRARRRVSWDCMDAIVIEEENNHEIDGDEIVDTFWLEAWNVHLIAMHRRDYDVDVNGTYHRVYPTRYLVPEFKATRSMRRVLSKNADLRCVTRPLRITPAKEDLFLAHHLQRFGYEPEGMLNQRYQYQESHPARLMETCCFLNEALIAFSIFEVGRYSLWSDLGVWSPAHARRGLGTLTILNEIEYARTLGHYFYYMGHYWPGNPDYEYKTRFQPMELYDWDDKCWRPWGHPVTEAMLTEILPRRSWDEK